MDQLELKWVEKQKREDDYRLFKARILRDICNMIFKSLGVITAISFILFLLIELTNGYNGVFPGITYLCQGLINLLTISPIHLRLLISILILVIIVSVGVVIIYPIIDEGDN